VPTTAATAPAANTSRTASGVAIPPAARSGRALAERTLARSSVRATSAGSRSGVSVPECPPALAAWTTSASTPASVAARASAASVTVWTVRLPARRNRCTVAESGIPKVKLTRGTGSPVSSSTFRSQSSSSSVTGTAVRSSPYGVPSPWIAAA